MKKKAIEKIPYLTLPKVSRKKRVEYIGVTAFQNIDHERHLLLEVYRNNKACRNVPVVRIVLNKNDFGTFFPESGTWSRGNIISCPWDNLIWEKENSKSTDIMEEENVLYSQKDLQRIKAFTNTSVWSERRWWEYIEKRQRKITETEYREKAKRKYERRQQALEERQENTPELPKDRILEYADTILFHNMHHLYYKKHGVRATVACSSCGGVSDERWKPGNNYESQFERIIQEPRMGDYGTCPMCGIRGKYMTQGHARCSYRWTGHLFLGQRYKEEGMVFRYIEVGKEWQLQLICGEKGEPEMYSSCEKLDGIEIVRAYFEPGKKMQKDFCKHDPYTGMDFWDDCNLYGNANMTIKEAHILPETYRNMEETFLKYSAMKEFQRAEVTINPVDYIERYIWTPQIEMLTKMGLIGVVKKMLKYEYGIVADEKANRADAFLGIRKERVKQLIDKKGDTDILKVMQMEKRQEQRWTDEQVEQLAEIRIYNTQVMFHRALEHTTVQKILNYISKQAGCEYGTLCDNAVGRLIDVTQSYFDYLGMRNALGYDMDNTVYLFPRNLSVAHNKMVMEHNKQEADKRLLEVAAIFPMIKKHYRSLRKVFYYEDENLMIRPARNAEEIVMEGRILHHCVGGNNYLDKHNRGTSIILFLRKMKEPEVPYITVEISRNDLKILQWYGANDKKPDQKNMERWLTAYETRMKCQRDGTLQEAAVNGAEGSAVTLLAYA